MHQAVGWYSLRRYYVTSLILSFTTSHLTVTFLSSITDGGFNLQIQLPQNRRMEGQRNAIEASQCQSSWYLLGKDLKTASPPPPAGFGPAGPWPQCGAHPLTSKMASCHVLPRQAGSRDITVQGELHQSDCEKCPAWPIRSLLCQDWITSPPLLFPFYQDDCKPLSARRGKACKYSPLIMTKSPIGNWITRIKKK